MTTEDEIYGAWLDILGSGTEEGEALRESLKALHDAAERSHPAAPETEA